MNIALIIAGGTGARMKQSIPKQFMHVDDKPIIAYTLEAFQTHPLIDAIAVVCIDGWHDVLAAYAKQYGITKLTDIIPGGDNGQSSIRNGVFALRDKFSPDDIVLVHDAIRPLVSQEIISGNISTCKLYGSAVTMIPCAEAMMTTEDQVVASGCYDRDKLKRSQTPQTYPLSKLVWAHEEALRRGITNAVASNSMLLDLGQQVHFFLGSEKNIKITTSDDLDILRALLYIKRQKH